MLEAQKLVGVNINPYVAVRVGDQRRVTTTQRGTNCPFYNEVGGWACGKGQNVRCPTVV